MPSSTALRRKTLKALKQRGYVVQVGALEAILDGYRALKHAVGDCEFAQYLEQIVDALSHRGNAPILSAGDSAVAVARVRDVVCWSEGVTGDALGLVDVFRLPTPPAVLRACDAGERARPVLDARPEAKAALFRARYFLLLEKTLRNARFSPPSSALSDSKAASARSKSPYLQLTAIDSLQSCEKDHLVLGMLTQMEEGGWFLEDLNGSIEIDLSEAHTTAGLHTECSFVIAQGRLELLDAGENMESERRIFKVFAMGTPPLEDRDISLSALGKDVNVFGGEYDPADEQALIALEEKAADAMFVIMSDVHLDNPRVMSGIRVMLEGYLEDGVVPTAVVLMGSFLSHPFGQKTTDPMTLSAAFTTLGEMIASDFPDIAESTTFVIVPSQHDLGPGNVLPRPRMPPLLTQGFEAALSPERVIHGTNPCRLRYLSQEIVLFREDLLHKMLRNCAVKPDNLDTSVMAEHMMKSIVDQAHLCPLPLASRPVLWALDHALWLFPSPHLVVVADKVDGYTFSYGSTVGLNPGSFGSDLSFAVYLPAERKSQQCTLDPAQLLGAGAGDTQDSIGEEASSA